MQTIDEKKSVSKIMLRQWWESLPPESRTDMELNEIALNFDTETELTECQVINKEGRIIESDFRESSQDITEWLLLHGISLPVGKLSENQEADAPEVDSEIVYTLTHDMIMEHAKEKHRKSLWKKRVLIGAGITIGLAAISHLSKWR